MITSLTYNMPVKNIKTKYRAIGRLVYVSPIKIPKFCSLLVLITLVTTSYYKYLNTRVYEKLID